MAFPVSPGVNFREIDLTQAIAEQISTNGSFAGSFVWGPAGQIVRVDSEATMVKRFGQPNNTTAIDFFTASSFLAYSSALDIVRIVDATNAKNAVSAGTPVLVANDNTYIQTALTTQPIVAKYPGTYGNNIGVSYVLSAAQFSGNFTNNYSFAMTRSTSFIVTRTSSDAPITSYVQAGSVITIGGIRYTVQSATVDIQAVSGGNHFDGVTLTQVYTGTVGTITGSTVSYIWQFGSTFGGVAPSAGSIYVIVYDATGKITAQVGSVIESFIGSSVAGTIDPFTRASVFIDDIINASKWIRAGISLSTLPTTGVAATNIVLTGGNDGVVALDQYITGYNQFANKDLVPASLIIGGYTSSTGKGAAANTVLGNYIIQNIAEVRKDCVVFVSPSYESVVNNTGNETTDVNANSDLFYISSYAACDSGWKYMYDRYNNVYRWIPLCGDHAGIYAQVDANQDPWYSAAGVNRGLIKNVVKLAWNPMQADRDLLYPNNVNPVYNVPGYGPTMFGDKTLLTTNSAFSRIQTRRLFIILEQTILTAAKTQLFEFNDTFSQNRFVSIIDPFLRDVKGRRGITDYAIIADSRVNTPQVVQNNRFVGQIYIKPQYSIEFIQLDFVAVGPTVDFSTVIGTF